MKFIQIAGGFLLPISVNEQKLYESIEKRGEVNFFTLSDREQNIAQNLVSRGALTYRMDLEDIYLQVNALEDIWRD